MFVPASMSLEQAANVVHLVPSLVTPTMAFLNTAGSLVFACSAASAIAVMQS